LTRVSATIPATPVAPAATKLAEAEKHIAFAHSLDSRRLTAPSGYTSAEIN
jgi:hypothetical protein